MRAGSRYHSICECKPPLPTPTMSRMERTSIHRRSAATCMKSSVTHSLKEPKAVQNQHVFPDRTRTAPSTALHLVGSLPRCLHRPPLPLCRIPRFILRQREEDLLPASCHVSASHKQLLVSLIPVSLPCGLVLPFALFGAQFTRRTSLYTVHVVLVTRTLLGRWQHSSYGIL